MTPRRLVIFGLLAGAVLSVVVALSCALFSTRDRSRLTPEAAEALKLTSKDMVRLGLVDEVIQEPLGGAHRDNKAAIELVRAQLETWLVELKALPKEELMEQRYQKFRHMGAPVEV